MTTRAGMALAHVRRRLRGDSARLGGLCTPTGPFRLDGCGSSYRRLHNVEGVLDTAPTLGKFLWRRRKHLQRLSDLFSAGHARDLDPPPKLSKTHTNDRVKPAQGLTQLDGRHHNSVTRPIEQLAFERCSPI